MTVNELMDNKKITKYRLSKDSGVAYTTVNDICSGRAQLENALLKRFTELRKHWVFHGKSDRTVF